MRFICILCFILTFFCGYKFIETANTCDRMEAANAAACNLLISLLDAETGQRGYLITGDQSYLVPYQLGAQTAAVRLAVLNDLLANTGQADEAKQITKEAKAKIDELQSTINLRNTNYKAAIAIVDSDLGKDLMDQARLHINNVQRWARNNYDKAQDAGRLFAQMGFVMLFVTLSSGIYIVARLIGPEDVTDAAQP